MLSANIQQKGSHTARTVHFKWCEVSVLQLQTGDRMSNHGKYESRASCLFK